MRFKILKSGGYTSGGISQAGGTMSGPLLLAADPVDPLEAATKNYVDTSVTNLDAGSVLAGTLPVASFPEITGDASNTAGTTSFSLSPTGVSPGTYVKAAVDAKGRVTNGFSLVEADVPDLPWSKITTGKPTTLAGYGITDALGPSGGTLTGTLSCSVAPTSNLHIANKTYVDNLAANMVGVVNMVTGDIIRKVTSTTPTGYLRCNGAEVSKTTYADLYTIIGETYSTRILQTYGRPWEQQAQGVVNAQSGDLTDWYGFHTLPAAVSQAAVAVTSTRIYIIGGLDAAGTYLNTVYAAKINTDGTVGMFAAAGTIPITVAYCRAFVTSSRVYVMGGMSNGTTWISNTYYSPITNGVISGTWTAGVALGEVMAEFGVCSLGNYVYTLGGKNGTSSYSAKIYQGVIDAFGVITSWTYTQNLGSNTFRQAVFQSGTRVTIIGGMQTNTTYKTAVLSNTLAVDGSTFTGSWTAGTVLPIALADMSVIRNGTSLLITGGLTTSAVRSSAQYYTTIAGDGTLGSWTSQPAFPGGAFDGGIVVNLTNRSFILGGNYGSGSTTKVYTFEHTVSNSVDAYPTLGYGSMLNSLSDSSVFMAKNNIYVIGGRTTAGVESTTTTVAKTPGINTDGTIASWGSSTSFSTNLADAAVVVTKNRVYLLGGSDTAGTAAVSTVYTAPLNTDGTVGTWVATTSLPIPLRYTCVVNTGVRVYLLGGQTTGGTYISTTYVSTLNSDGTLGTWSNANNALKSAVGGGQLAVTKNFIRVCGGYNGTTYTNEVQLAPLNSDGTIGTWVNDTALPGAIAFGACAVTNNAVYLLGGITTGGTYVATVYKGTIAVDGSITGWSAISSLPIAMAGCSAIIAKNHLFLIGGKNSTTRFHSVLGIVINGGSNDYTGYWDGSIAITDAAKFKLPDYSTKELFGSYTYIKT